MKRVRDDGQFRRYLLGEATDAEREAIERAYFEHPDRVDAVSAVEDDLIDDYLSGRLERDERKRFERHYLSSPGHRRRVAVVRAIASAAAATTPVERRRSGITWWAAAGLAAAVIVVVGAVWSISSRLDPASPPADTRSLPAPPPADTPRVDRGEVPRDAAPGRRPPAPGTRAAEPAVIALAISPILARGADQPATVTITSGTDAVRLVLLGEPGERDRGGGRAIVRTVAGREIWRGAAVADAGPAGRAAARVEIPAALLPPDDYIVQLLGTDSRGTEVERYRYFFSVRAP